MLTYRLKAPRSFPGTTTTNTKNDPAAPEVSTTGDHRRIFTHHGAPTGAGLLTWLTFRGFG